MLLHFLQAPSTRKGRDKPSVGIVPQGRPARSLADREQTAVGRRVGPDGGVQQHSDPPTQGKGAEVGRGPALTKRLPWATPGRGEGPANHIKGTPPLSEGGVRATTAGTLATPMSSSGPSTGQQSMVDKINGRGGEGQMQEPQPAASSLHAHSKGTPQRAATGPRLSSRSGWARAPLSGRMP